MKIRVRSGEAFFGRPWRPDTWGSGAVHQVGEALRCGLPPRETEAVRQCHVDVVSARIITTVVDIAHPDVCYSVVLLPKSYFGERYIWQ